MIVTIDPSSPVPTFEQLRSQISSLIALGALAPGTHLPPIRQIAKDLAIAPGTVARSYKELEAAGQILSQGRRGTVVLQPTHAAEKTQESRTLIRKLVTELRRLGTTEELAMAFLREAYATTS